MSGKRLPGMALNDERNFLMKGSDVYQKRIVLIIATALLLFGVQALSYSQEHLPPGRSVTFNPKELSVDEIYDKTIHSLLWILADAGQGSGVLIDKELRLAVTNYHVTKESDSIVVVFPVRDRYGYLTYERDFYLNKSNQKVLERLGYATTGHIVAKEPTTDMVIVQLDGLPDTAREIKHNFEYSTHLHMSKNDQVHILGNPADLALWRWTGGFFQGVDDQGMIQINADIYKGNSGGPVLNNRGMLIGIATRSNEERKAWAVPANHINHLLATLKPRKIFNILNDTLYTLPSQVGSA